MKVSKEQLISNLERNALRKFVYDRELVHEVEESIFSVNDFFGWNLSNAEIVMLVKRSYREAVKQLNS